MDLATVVDELYGLPLDAFTLRRDALAKEARAAKDRDLARDIAGLRKPSAAAWAINITARDAPDEVDAVLSLGEAIQSAQSGNAAVLRGLLGARQAVVAAAVHQARIASSKHDHPISEAATGEVEQTLRAAMADAAVAEVVRLGRLTAAITSSVLAGLDLSAVIVPASAAKPDAPRGTELRLVPVATAEEPAPQTAPDPRLEAAERAVADAEAESAVAASALTDAQTTAERADADADAVRAEIEELTRQLRDAEDRLTDAQTAQAQAKQATTTAEIAASDARSDVAAARRDLTKAMEPASG